MIDFTAFRGAFQLIMEDKMTVKRLVPGGTDEWGITKPSRWDIIYEDVKCRVSQMNQNFDNPNAEEIENVPVLYKLKVFAPQFVKLQKGDLITLTRTIDNIPTTYELKRTSDFMQYTNHIEFYIGINEVA